jgi:hypothetical protein
MMKDRIFLYALTLIHFFFLPFLPFFGLFAANLASSFAKVSSCTHSEISHSKT